MVKSMLLIQRFYNNEKCCDNVDPLSVWGDTSVAGSESAAAGFGENEGFDSFLSMTAPPQEQKIRKADSADSDDAPDFSVFIKQVL